MTDRLPIDTDLAPSQEFAQRLIVKSFGVPSELMERPRPTPPTKRRARGRRPDLFLALAQGRNNPELKARRAIIYQGQGRSLARPQKAQLIQSTLRIRGKVASAWFVKNGLLLWMFKDQELFREVASASMHSWLADPENKIKSLSGAELQIQVIDLFYVFFQIRLGLMLDVGWGKFQIITHRIELLRAEVEDARRDVSTMAIRAEQLRLGCLAGLREGTLTHQEVAAAQEIAEAEMQAAAERAIALYQAHRETAIRALIAATGTSSRGMRENELDDGGWETLFSSPLPMGVLRGMVSRDFLEMATLERLTDNDEVIVEIRRRKESHER